MTTHLSRRGRETTIAMAVIGGLYAIYGVMSGLSIWQSVDTVISVLGWLILIGVFLRALWLPVQYLRHRAAIRRFEQKEADLIERASRPGPAGAAARVRLSMHPDPDPRAIPWWRW